MDEHRQRESLSFEKASKKKQRSRYLAWSIDNPLLVITSIVLMMLAVIFIVGSNFESRSSQIEKTEIGTIASHDYKAPRDFTFDRIDQEATEKIREQRVAEVLPIFKWDSNYQDATLSKFRSAFEFMRNGMDSERMRLEDSHVQKDTKTLIASETHSIRHGQTHSSRLSKTNQFLKTISPRENSPTRKSLRRWSHGAAHSARLSSKNSATICRLTCSHG